jgi:ADP-heptose:LPS heptosyltransferase
MNSPVASRTPSLSEWVIVSVKEPVLWSRSLGEVWMLNPRCRYVINASQVESLGDKIASLSDLKNSRFFSPLQANRNLANSTILVERNRDRGFGDYLFLTGPFDYIKHVSGGSAQIDVYALAEKSKILENHPTLSHPVPFAGPVLYDNLHLYNYHWFIDAVTEYNEEKDQLNVYDALYKQLGIDPSTVSSQFKRPSMLLTPQDYKDLDSLYFYVYSNKKIDLRRTGYYVVAPSTNASLRSAPYSMWLKTIYNLSKARPVVVVGQSGSRVPATDMPFGSFVEQLDQLGPNVVNLIGGTPVRVVASLISRSSCCFTLDSGLLYVAQALRIPCVSLWGPVSPWSRIGYDKDYMDLAIWNREACAHASCFAYSGFPVSKCPRGSSQNVCEPLISVTAEQVLDKAKLVEDRSTAQRPA